MKELPFTSHLHSQMQGMCIVDTTMVVFIVKGSNLVIMTYFLRIESRVPLPFKPIAQGCMHDLFS